MNLIIDAGVIWPALVPLLGVVVVLVVDLVAPRLRSGPWAVAAVAAGLTAWTTVPGVLQDSGAARRSFCVAGPSSPDLGVLTSSECFWEADNLGSALQLAAALSALVCVALAWPASGRSESAPDESPGWSGVWERRTREAAERQAASGGQGHASVEATLLLAALSGTTVVAASHDVGTWLVALELATIPVIVLVALSGRRAAAAGAVQLLVTSLVSFALLALGVAVWFAATGSPFFSAALTAVGPTTAPLSEPSAGLLALSVVLILGGLGFKLSLVPFHAWTPTAYSGASTAVATFLATVSKIAALAALVVVLRAVVFLGTTALLSIALLATLSMTLGNLVALRQTDVVRLLAWSTVAQAGWVVLPLVAVSASGTRAAATYLLTYVVATLVAFAVVALTVHEVGDRGRSLAAYGGLWRRHPVRAGALALALTSLAGLPPGVIGLVGKVAALRPVVAEGLVWLAVIAAANAVLGVAVYLRWVRPVISVDGSADTDGRYAAGPGRPGGAVGRRRAIVLGLVGAAAVLVVVSGQPQLLLGLLG